MIRLRIPTTLRRATNGVAVVNVDGATVREALLAAIATIVQLSGLALPLGVTTTWIMFPAMFVVGAASGATTVLRPLLVVELVGAAPFAATNARLQRASTLARAAAPLVLGLAVSALGWSLAWSVCLAAFALAAERYIALGRLREPG